LLKHYLSWSSPPIPPHPLLLFVVKLTYQETMSEIHFQAHGEKLKVTLTYDVSDLIQLGLVI
jgi:hypothetical protein